MTERDTQKPIGLILVIIALSILLFLYFYIPYLVSTAMPSPELTAAASLMQIAKAQAIFIKTDYYVINKLVYANPDNGGGISDLYEVNDFAHKTLDRTVARADDSNPDPIPKAGYLVRDLKCDDYTKQFAVLAYPVRYNFMSRNIYVINETGTVYQIDAKVLYPGIKSGDKITPPDKYPTEEELKKWILIGQ